MAKFELLNRMEDRRDAILKNTDTVADWLKMHSDCKAATGKCRSAKEAATYAAIVQTCKD